MTGTFSSVNSALSALRYQQVVMDVTSGNVANVGSDGYVRRRVSGEAVGAPAQPAMWSRYDGAGEGVRISGVDRMVDPLLDARARREHGNQSYLDVRQGVLERLESGIGEPGDNGVSAALAEFRKSWADLANNPGSEAARNQVLAKAASLADSIRIQARNVVAEEGDQRSALQTDVGEVNTLASDLAATNKSIAIANINGTDAGTLLDKRDALALRLSELTGAVATPRTDGGFDVAVGGVQLVNGQDAGTLVIASGVKPNGDADGQSVTFSVTAPGGAITPVTDALRGEIGSEAELLNTTLPTYLKGLDDIALKLFDEVNAQHQKGYDQAGNGGEPLLACTPPDIAGTLKVAISDPAQVAASSVSGDANRDGGNALAMGAAITVGTDYQRLVTGFGSDVASTRRLALNQQTLTTQVDASREQLSGVNLDEEMVNMLTAQRAYEAAARVMTTVDSVLDTLINRTGMTR